MSWTRKRYSNLVQVVECRSGFLSTVMLLLTTCAELTRVGGDE